MNDNSRRIIGLICGLLMGLAYGLISIYINPLFLPEIPLALPDIGRFASLMLTIMSSGLLGLLAAWPEDALPGILLSSLVGALVSTFFSMRGLTGGFEVYSGLFILALITFFPRAFVFLPLAALTRWLLNFWGNELQDRSFSVPKLALSLLGLVLIAGITGMLSLYSRDGRQVLRTTNEMIVNGMQVQDSTSLPEALTPVDGFLQAASGPYTLRLSNNPDILPVQRPMTAYFEEEYAVIVRFENGFRFGCAFTPPYDVPYCRNY